MYKSLFVLSGIHSVGRDISRVDKVHFARVKHSLDPVCVGGGVCVCGMGVLFNIASRSGGRFLEKTDTYQM